MWVYKLKNEDDTSNEHKKCGARFAPINPSKGSPHLPFPFLFRFLLTLGEPLFKTKTPIFSFSLFLLRFATLFSPLSFFFDNPSSHLCSLLLKIIVHRCYFFSFFPMYVDSQPSSSSVCCLFIKRKDMASHSQQGMKKQTYPVAVMLYSSMPGWRG